MLEEDFNLIKSHNSLKETIKHQIKYWEDLMKENPTLDPTLPLSEINKLKAELYE